MSKYYISNYGYADPMYLEHYGVLGMKWGVRHDQERLERRSARKNARLDKRAKKLGGTRTQLDEARKAAKIKKRQRLAKTRALYPLTGITAIPGAIWGAGAGGLLGGLAGAVPGAIAGAIALPISNIALNEVGALINEYITANNIVRELQVRDIDAYNRIREVETHHRGS